MRGGRCARSGGTGDCQRRGGKATAFSPPLTTFASRVAITWRPGCSKTMTTPPRARLTLPGPPGRPLRASTGADRLGRRPQPTLIPLRVVAALAAVATSGPLVLVEFSPKAAGSCDGRELAQSKSGSLDSARLRARGLVTARSPPGAQGRRGTRSGRPPCRHGGGGLPGAACRQRRRGRQERARGGRTAHSSRARPEREPGDRSLIGSEASPADSAPCSPC